MICCEIFYREMCDTVARSVNQVDVEFLPKGLHDLGVEGMQGRLREVLAVVDEERYEAVLFGYGLCNNGLVGLAACSIPLIIPRGHDCITLFFGSKERYREYFDGHPGVYFKTSGWMEREKANGELSQLSIQHSMGMDMSFEDLVEKYGEENAKYVYETLHAHESAYHQFTFIDMGMEWDERFEERSRKQAEKKGWAFEKVQGDMGLIRRLADGPWNDDEFLTVRPGQRVVAVSDEGIVGAEEIQN